MSLCLGYRHWRAKQRDRIATQRRTRGLTTDILLTRPHRIADQKRRAIAEISLTLAIVIGLPILLAVISELIDHSTAKAAQQSIALCLGLMIVISLISAAPALRAAASGWIFKTVATFTLPFQVGDRIITQGIQGKVIKMTALFITLDAGQGRQINLPTQSLWQHQVTTVNGDGHSSFSKVVFYLSPNVTAQQRETAETLLRETIETSPYIEPSRPIQILWQQKSNHIQLTATAYVATGNNIEPFNSDVNCDFLAYAQQKKIPLAAASKPTTYSHSKNRAQSGSNGFSAMSETALYR